MHSGRGSRALVDSCGCEGNCPASVCTNATRCSIPDRLPSSGVVGAGRAPLRVSGLRGPGSYCASRRWHARGLTQPHATDLQYAVSNGPTGGPVRVYVLPDSPVHRTFAKDLLSLYPETVAAGCGTASFTPAPGQAPEPVGDPVEMRQRVANTPGAIGYLPSEMIDETVRELSIR